MSSSFIIQNLIIYYLVEIKIATIFGLVFLKLWPTPALLKKLVVFRPVMALERS